MPDHIQKIVEERDAQAFQSLFLTFAPRVRTMMLRQGADSATAEDIAQETMMTVWRKGHLFVENRGSLAGWIFAIARNLRIDRVRRQVVWQDLAEDYPNLSADQEPPDDSIARKQLCERVRTAWAQLPAEQSEVIGLFFINGLSHSEIAERLKLPLGTVKSRVRLARTKILDSLEGRV